MNKHDIISNLSGFKGEVEKCCYLLVTCKAHKNKFRIKSINMKKLTLLISILFFAIVSFAQSDIIYPTINKKDIRRCRIIDVKNNNVVYYLKGSETDSIEAVAILRDNLFINLKSKNQLLLYKNQDFNYYKKQYNHELIDQKIGMWITISGLGLFATSFIVSNYSNKHSSYDGSPTAILIGIGAIINTSIGIGMWTSARIKAKKYKKAMEMTNPNVNLSFGTTKNGIGLILNF